MTDYATRLEEAVRTKRTPALVGLDPRFDQLPACVVREAKKREPDGREALRAAAYELFCSRIVDVVAPLVPAIKPQAAFFEECGSEGLAVLARVIRRARRAGLIVIADVKRGDIGSTAEAYASAWIAGSEPEAAPFAADAVTVNPYLGDDALAPFFDAARKRGGGVYVLVRTSNPGARAFQDWSEQGEPLYRRVAAVVSDAARETAGSDRYGSIGAVVGATYPDELRSLREAMPRTPFLVPGYGSQGGTSADVAAAFDADGLGALVSSRGINFAHLREPFRSQFGDERWEDGVEAATRAMIDDLAANTPAGALRSE